MCVIANIGSLNLAWDKDDAWVSEQLVTYFRNDISWVRRLSSFSHYNMAAKIMISI